MIEDPRFADKAFLSDADGTVIGVDPLTVHLSAASGPGVLPMPGGDVRPEDFGSLGEGPRPRPGDTVRLIRNIAAPDRWVFSMVLRTAPPPPAPKRCAICGTVAVVHDSIRCEATSARPLADVIAQGRSYG